MSSVFQINTVYQLFITINMRLNEILPDKADIILSDHTPVLKNYINGLKRSGLFNNVFYIESLAFNKYFWGAKDSKKASIFYSCENNSMFNRIISNSGVKYSNYENLFIANLDAFTKCLHKQNPELNIIQIEDGASICSTNWKKISEKWSFIEGFNNIYDDLKAIYLYSPDLMCFDTPIPKIQLPNIQKDKDTIKLYNDIFQYKKVNFPRFTFIEQSFQVDGIYNNDLEFMQATFDIVGYGNLYIKPHPRNTINRPFAFGLSKCIDDSVPFELMLLNCSNTDSVFITVDSGSLISSRVIFNSDIKTIFLYKAITGKTHIHGSGEFTEYMNKFTEKYASPNLMIPGSIEEYRCILHHLM